MTQIESYNFLSDFVDEHRNILQKIYNKLGINLNVNLESFKYVFENYERDFMPLLCSELNVVSGVTNDFIGPPPPPKLPDNNKKPFNWDIVSNISDSLSNLLSGAGNLVGNIKGTATADTVNNYITTEEKKSSSTWIWVCAGILVIGLILFFVFKK